MKKLLVGATVLSALALGACTTTGGDNYNALVKEAKAKQEQSVKNDNVWMQKRMKQPYADDYLAQAEAARKESVRLAEMAVKIANAQLEQTKASKALQPGWYK